MWVSRGQFSDGKALAKLVSGVLRSVLSREPETSRSQRNQGGYIVRATQGRAPAWVDASRARAHITGVLHPTQSQLGAR